MFKRPAAYLELIRLHRPIGAFLLLWPTWWALWMAAGGRPDGWIFAVFTLGVLCMRSAGCAINDYLDRDIDPHVKRTRNRPLARGAVRPWEALALAVLLALVSLALVLTLDPLTIRLAVIGAVLAGSYPLAKRVTHLPQVYLGLAFSWGIPMAFAAETGGVPPVAWVVVAANLFWVVAFDTIYAMVDRDDDLRIGVKSAAILFGEEDRLIIGVLQASALAALAVAGHHFGYGMAYYLGLAAAGGFALYHQRLIRERRREDCFRAFLHNNFFGAAVFFGLVAELGVS